MAEEKVNKKKQKALAFRKSKEEREQEKAAKAEQKAALEVKETEKKRKADDASEGDQEPKKKRKTRRGKKGKGVNEGKGPRFILFVGNLPFDIQQAELVAHFKNANPDRIRLRKEKGIAFLEFDNDNQEIQKKMDLALRLHHSVIRKRKINVELTVGGGGNSENRTQKLKEKNEKLEEERRTRIKAEEAKKRKDEPASTGGMHPARAALLKNA